MNVDGGKETDGYDTDGDGLINEIQPYSSARARYVENTQPYYARPNFNWNYRSNWINDQNAINYWIHFVKPNQYPTEFTSKTY